MNCKRLILSVVIAFASLLVVVASSFSQAPKRQAAASVVLVNSGEPQMAIASGSTLEAAAELKQYLDRIAGANFTIVEATKDERGLHVGLFSDFPWLKSKDDTELGPEGFVIRTDDRGVYLLARTPRGVQHAVATFLQRLGCRWFFPGKAWEVVPRMETIAGSWNEIGRPSFPTQRRIWYGFGAYGPCRDDLEAWNRHNRMGGPIEVGIGHTWHGLNPEKDFAEHPDWFALTGGKRQPTKPCYSHPQVIARAIEFALARAAAGEEMISMTPPDGLGYCECERCLSVCQGAKPYEAHSTLFARRPDGTRISVTSENVFHLVNQVAEAVAKKYPQTLVGCYAYSAYSHPPSFDLHPNVYLQTTTAYRRTPISLEQQLAEFGTKTTQLGIREYYSVYQWDWDNPDPGKLTPAQLQEDLRFFHRNGVTAVNAESSNNWAPRGLGYYLAANLMWNVDADTDELTRDFYIKAFGPAARVIEQYYVRWYGAEVAVLDSADSDVADQDGAKQTFLEKGKYNREALAAAFNDLDEAARLVRDQPAYRGRVDQLRMYLHYLLLRYQLAEATQTGNQQQILDAIQAETEFGGRLTYTNMIHTRPLIGKAFLRRFRQYAEMLESVPDAQQSGRGWRQVSRSPSEKEIEGIWQQDLAALGINSERDD